MLLSDPLADGQRCVEFFEFAIALSRRSKPDQPRASAIMYLTREALLASVRRPPGGGRRGFKSIGADIVKAYDLLVGDSGGDPTSLHDGRTLSSLILELREFMQGDQGVHFRNMASFVRRTTGHDAPQFGGSVHERYQSLVDRANTGLHSSATLTDARGLLAEAMLFVAAVFAPARSALQRIDRECRKVRPTAASVAQLCASLRSVADLDYFFSRCQSPYWLRALLQHEPALVMPCGTHWPPMPVFARFGADHAPYLEQTLRGMLQHGDLFEADGFVDYAGHAARLLGPRGRHVLLLLLRKFPTSMSLGVSASHMLEETSPEDEFVFEVCDILLNPVKHPLHGHLATEALRVFTRGLNRDTRVSRLKLLGKKFTKIGQKAIDDLFLLNRFAPLPNDLDSREEYPQAVAHFLALAMDATPANEPLAKVVEALSCFPEPLRVRGLARFLAGATDTSFRAGASFVAKSLDERPPNGEDVRLIASLTTSPAKRDQFAGMLAAVLGPSDPLLSKAKHFRDVPAPLENRCLWVQLLPHGTAGEWEAQRPLLESLGFLVRKELFTGEEPDFSFSAVTSPLSASDLAELDPSVAAKKIGSWRPLPHDSSGSALELARALERDATARAGAWVAQLERAIRDLREPTYIAHLLTGLAKGGVAATAKSDQILPGLSLAISKPWEPVNLGDDPGLDYDVNWKGVDAAVVTLVEALANSEAEFIQDWPPLWPHIEREFEYKETPLAAGSRFDEYTSALNSRACRSLVAALAVAAQAHRSGRPIPENLIKMLDAALSSTRSISMALRATVVRHLALIRTIEGSWLESRIDLLFDPPDRGDVGERTQLLAMRWGPPGSWLLVRLRESIFALAARDDIAGTKMLVGMLRGLEGFDVDSVAKRTGAVGRVGSAGRTLAKMLTHEGVTPEHLQIAVAFWRKLLHLAKAGTDFSGFGRWYAVDSLGHSEWLELTLSSIRVTERPLEIPWEIAARVSRGQITPQSLDLLSRLLRGTDEHWERSEVGSHAIGVLRASRSDLGSEPSWLLLQKTLVDFGFHAAGEI